MRSPRFTAAELDAMNEAISFRLAGEIESDDNAPGDGEPLRDALEAAQRKVQQRLDALQRAAKGSR